MGKHRDPAATSPARLADRERQTRAVAMRAAGRSYADIADALDYSSADTARKSVAALLDRVESDAADELRVLEGRRLDMLQAAVWPSALEGHLPAVDRVVRISERRARLFGLDRARDAYHSDAETVMLAGQISDALASLAGLPDTNDGTA